MLPLEYPILLNAPIRKHLEWWDNKGRFISGCNTETVSTNTQSFHGCEPLRMGSPSRTGRTAVSWSLDSRPISSSYQCFRDESNITSSKTMSPICLQFNSDDCHRQLFGSFVSEERRGHPFSICVHGDMGDTPAVQSGRNKSSGETNTILADRLSRLSKPMNWNGMHNYAFPPFALIPAIINKIYANFTAA